MSRTDSELAHLFRALKAPAAARTLPTLAGRARAEEWSFERCAAALLKTEINSRDSHGGQAASWPPASRPERPSRSSTSLPDQAAPRNGLAPRPARLPARQATSPTARKMFLPANRDFEPVADPVDARRFGADMRSVLRTSSERRAGRLRAVKEVRSRPRLPHASDARSGRPASAPTTYPGTPESRPASLGCSIRKRRGAPRRRRCRRGRSDGGVYLNCAGDARTEQQHATGTADRVDQPGSCDHCADRIRRGLTPGSPAPTRAFTARGMLGAPCLLLVEECVGDGRRKCRDLRYAAAGPSSRGSSKPPGKRERVSSRQQPGHQSRSRRCTKPASRRSASTGSVEETA
jgi:hypothetical protein